MTRIIAGSLGGRRIAVPRGASTRPTSDRVREALFSRVEALVDLTGARVLDLYAGSGALGLEAASRGAQEVLLVEAARSAAQVAARNVRDLELGAGVRVVTDRVERVLRRGPGRTAYDLVLADPPYRLPEEDLSGVLADLLDRGWLAPDPLVVLERSARSPVPGWPPGMRLLESRAYGDTALHLAESVGGDVDMLAP